MVACLRVLWCDLMAQGGWGGWLGLSMAGDGDGDEEERLCSDGRWKGST